MEAGDAMGKRLSQLNKGFTLVELCAVMVIFSILASITTVSLMSWHQYAQNNKANENAELIYMALKNKISVLKANNILYEVSDYFPDPEEQDEATPANNKNKQLICQKGDYSNYIDPAKETTGKKDADTILEFVLPYINDKTILDACIAVELNNDRDIIAVYYCDRCESFKFSSGTSSEAIVKLKTIKNNEDERYNLVVGMYVPN